MARLSRLGREVHRRAIVGQQLVVQAPNHVVDRPITKLFVGHGIRPFGPGQPEKLHVGARQKVPGTLSQDKCTGDRRRGVFHRYDHLGGGEALLDAPVVRFEHLPTHRERKVLLLEAAQIQIAHPGGGKRRRIEVPVVVAPLLGQDALVLGARNGAARTDTNPNSSLVANRGGVRRANRRDRHRGTGEDVLSDRQRGGRENVPVSLDVGELPQQIIRDVESRWSPVIAHTDEDDPRPSMVQKIVGERADGVTDGSRRVPLQRLLALHEFRLEVRHHRFELAVGVCVTHVGASVPAGHSLDPQSTLVAPESGSRRKGRQT